VRGFLVFFLLLSIFGPVRGVLFCQTRGFLLRYTPAFFQQLIRSGVYPFFNRPAERTFFVSGNDAFKIAGSVIVGVAGRLGPSIPCKI
jgi:hypothetical protein